MAHGLRSLSAQAVAGPLAGEVYAFGPVRIDVARHVATRDGQPLALAPKTFELLLILVRSGGRVLSRQELIAALWPDTFVEEANLSFQISTLRRALGDAASGAAADADGAEPWIETVPKLGYRFTPAVTASTDARPRRGVSAAAERAEILSERATRALVASLTAAGILVLAVLSVAWFVRSRAQGAPSVRSIAVLPFEDLSEGKGDVQYADGLTEALIAELSTLDGLNKVIGRQSVARFRAAPIPLRDAARALDVDAIVTASVLRSAGRLRVTARLVDGATERHLWAATYERPDGEVLLIQRQVVEAIADAIQLALGPEALARMPKAHAVGAAAFDAYVAGLQAVNAGPAHTVQAIGHFETAAAIDPEFAPAQAALARSLWRGALLEVPVPDAHRRGKAAAARAIALDPNLGEAHAARSVLLLHSDWDWAAADAALRRAIALSPNAAMVRSARAQYLALAARYDEAIDEARRAVELDPSSHTIGSLAWANFHARRYEEAVRRWLQVEGLDGDPVPLGLSIVTLALAGRADEVRASCAADAARGLAWRCAQGQALLGNPVPALRLIEEAPASAGLLTLADTYGALGDAAGAVRTLERAYDTRDLAVLYMNSPLFDSVRHDAAFRNLQRRMNYPGVVDADGRIGRE